MARTYKTLSISLPPGIVEKLSTLGKATGRVAARVATEIVLREIVKATTPERAATRRTSWCCDAIVVPNQGIRVMTNLPAVEWVPVIALLCSACRKQMHGREYEGWIADA